jgi:hypothetical protein
VSISGAGGGCGLIATRGRIALAVSMASLIRPLCPHIVPPAAGGRKRQMRAAIDTGQPCADGLP